MFLANAFHFLTLSSQESKSVVKREAKVVEEINSLTERHGAAKAGKFLVKKIECSNVCVIWFTTLVYYI